MTKPFHEPTIEILHLEISDVITSSSIFDYDDLDNTIIENELIGWRQ